MSLVTEKTGTEKRPCPACGKELLPTPLMKVRSHKSTVSPEHTCPGSGQQVVIDPDEKFLEYQTRENRERILKRVEERRTAVQLAITGEDGLFGKSVPGATGPEGPADLEYSSRTRHPDEPYMADVHGLPYHPDRGGYGPVEDTPPIDNHVPPPDDDFDYDEGIELTRSLLGHYPDVEADTDPDGSPSGVPLGQPERDFEWESTAGLQASPWEYPAADKVTEADALMPVVFNQPAKPSKRERKPLTPEAAALKAQLVEVFWSAANSQKRTQQTSIGPSEIGHPCDRRIGYKLLGQPVVNHRHDGWSAWKGTQIHKGLEGIFKAADKGRGRYLVDFSVPVAPPLIPSGTLDRADRVLCVIEDDKAVGANTLSKMWLDGRPSQQYRIQLQTYAYGMAQSGERFDRVALCAWPMESSNLDEMWVHVEAYDERIALDAIRRVYAIEARVRTEMRVDSLDMEPTFLCGFCPYHMENSPDPRLGCRGESRNETGE